jgi:hypothetical protein
MSNPTIIMVFHIFWQTYHGLMQCIILIWKFLPLLPQLDGFPFVSSSHYLHCFTLDKIYLSNVLIPPKLHGAFQCFKCHFHMLSPFSTWNKNIHTPLNKKNPSSCNICLTTHQRWALNLTCIQSKMFPLDPTLIRSTNVCPVPCANMNVFSNITVNGIGHNGFMFSMLRIATTIIWTSCLLCVHGTSGRIVCRSDTIVTMWYIGCHPQVMCSLQRAIAYSQTVIFFVTNSLTFCCHFSFHWIFKPMIVFTSSLCST